MSRRPKDTIHPETGWRNTWTRRPNGDIVARLLDDNGNIVSQGVMSLADAKRMAAGDRKDGYVPVRGANERDHA